MPASIAGAAIILDGTDCWATRRQGLASAFGARFDMEVDAFAISVLAIAVVKAATVPFRVLAMGNDAAIFTRGRVDAGGTAPAVAGLQPADTSGRPHSEHRAALRPRLRDIPGWAAESSALALGRLAFSCAADIVMLLSIPPNWVGRG
jgi:hypothetical protein